MHVNSLNKDVCGLQLCDKLLFPYTRMVSSILDHINGVPGFKLAALSHRDGIQYKVYEVSFPGRFENKIWRKIRLDYSDELELQKEANEVEQFAMTSLGRLIFVDIHCRHPKSLSLDKPSIDSLSLAFENLFYMPFDIIENYGNTLHTLDISHNKFSRNLQFLAEFENLTSLNLDHNNIDDHTVFPHMPKLQLLWLNHNNIEELYPFIKTLHESVPNLRYLCLMGNKAAPSYLNGGTFYDYLQYRLYVISWFPYLVHLDDRTVTPEQRQEAKRLFKRPLLENITEYAPLPECIKHLHHKIANMFLKPTLPYRLKSRGTNFIV